METIDIRDFRKNIELFFQKTITNKEPIVIKDDLNGEIVIIAKADYDSFQETFYLLKSPANAKRLLEGIEQYEQSRNKS